MRKQRLSSFKRTRYLLYFWKIPLMKHLTAALLLICVLMVSCHEPAEEIKPVTNTNEHAVIKPAEGIIKILDPGFNTEVDVIKLKEDYFANIKEEEKAIIGYYATFHGNECWWENNKPNETNSNLRCKIIDALKLGYQCSDTHLEFLKKWFRSQPQLLQELDHCPTIPTTSTLQDSFEEITVERKKDVFTIRFTICAVNLRDNITRCYEEVHAFRIFTDGVEEIKSSLL
jgi:hypothetical protein